MDCFTTDTPPFLHVKRYVAVLTCLGFSALFVLSLYVWRMLHELKQCCRSPQGSTTSRLNGVGDAPGSNQQHDGGVNYVQSRFDRNHPVHIRERMLSIFVVCLTAPLILWGALDRATGVSLWTALGLRIDGLAPALFLPLILTMTLFLGPLVLLVLANCSCHRSALDRPSICSIKVGCSDWQWQTFMPAEWASLPSLQIWRNIVVAPLAEEWVFRACMVPMLLSGGVDLLTIVFVCPFFFGISHFHHVWHMAQSVGWRVATLQCLFQVAFTSAFGMYATFLFIRTGSFVAPFLVHAFCNSMGVPDVSAASTHERRTVIGVAYVLGLIGFVTMLATGVLMDPDIYKSPYCHGV